MSRKKDKKPERDCPHVDISQKETRHPGVTRDIIVTWKRCNDCGHSWNESRNA